MALSAWTESGADLFPLGTKPLLELSPNGLAYAGQWRDNGSRDKCFDIALVQRRSHEAATSNRSGDALPALEAFDGAI